MGIRTPTTISFYMSLKVVMCCTMGCLVTLNER